MKVQARFQRAKFPEDSRFASFNVGVTDFKLQGDEKAITALVKNNDKQRQYNDYERFMFGCEFVGDV
ncbi:MAG: hypothetical protein HY842_09470 [Bacteroidetes bacterium]|nr:hypothetical protein [Bacteroidota bacterium]